jgi:hypothetical protein
LLSASAGASAAHSAGVSTTTSSIFSSFGLLAEATTASTSSNISNLLVSIFKSETLIKSQTFSSFSRFTSIVSIKSFGKTFTFNSSRCFSIIAPLSIAALERPIKDKGILVVTFSPFVMAKKSI